MDFLQEARIEVEIAAGELVPEFVQVQDGYYTHRLVPTERFVADWVDSSTSPAVTDFAIERFDVPVPKYHTELVWRSNSV